MEDNFSVQLREDVPDPLRYEKNFGVCMPRNHYDIHNIFVILLQDLAEIIEEELEAEAQDPCNGRTCSMNEQCCNGHVCVDTEDSK